MEQVPQIVLEKNRKRLKKNLQDDSMLMLRHKSATSKIAFLRDAKNEEGFDLMDHQSW